MMSPLSPDEFIALRSTVGWPSPRPDAVQMALQQSIAIATERDHNGTLVGMARAVGDGLYVLVVDVVVAPTAQDQGIGGRLVQTLLDDPRVARADHLELFAAPDAVDLYASLGFTPQEGTYMRR